jgi:hypothetical protein
MKPENKAKLSQAIDLITSFIDGWSDEYPEVAEANELLCEIYEEE